MEQIFRIEIPVEAVDKTDKGMLERLEANILKIIETAKKNKDAVPEVFENGQ